MEGLLKSLFIVVIVVLVVPQSSANQFIYKIFNPVEYLAEIRATIVSPISQPFPAFNLTREFNNMSSSRPKPTPEFGTATNTEDYVIFDVSKGPPPFSILMNFQSDGTSLIQVLQDNSAFGGNSGLCKHGKIYDPLVQICRDAFCSEGYTLTAKGCLKDTSYNSTKSQNEPLRKPDEITVELTLKHVLCLLKVEFNDTGSCEHSIISAESQFLPQLTASLSKMLYTNESRFADIKIVSVENVTENVTLSGDKYVLKRECLKVSILLRNNIYFVNDYLETLTLYLYLIMLSMQNQQLDVGAHKLALTEVIESKNTSAKVNWCNSPGDSILFYASKSDVRLYASFESDATPSYYVYVPKTGILYESGKFTLTVLYIPGHTDSQWANTLQDEDSSDEYFESLNHTAFIYWDLKQRKLLNDSAELSSSYLTLKDVTDIVLEKNKTVSTEIFLSVCNKRPRIKEDCYEHQIMRVGICELTLMKNRSYCSKLMSDCYSVDDYEYDKQQPNEYIMVCLYKQDSMNASLARQDEKRDKLLFQTAIDLLVEIPGWLSVVSLIVSICFMIATLFTYGLFKELRNIPGWNTINLTVALCIAEGSFLAGSFSDKNALICFLVAISTHYGFLASFCWMNVIAFDLYRNFRAKSSHVLIMMIRIRERLPKYALFGWGAPLVIIIICIVIDVSMAAPNVQSMFRPCYASYLDGCIKLIDVPIRNNQSNMTLLDKQCFPDQSSVYRVALLSRTCWIMNGYANLIYFGIPIGVIILANGLFFILTIIEMRKRKLKHKLRRFSRVKIPGDAQVKFYVQISIFMGFTWVVGFFLTTFSASQIVINQILIYLFILSNASIGVFIFFVFIFRVETLNLYRRLFAKYRAKLLSKSDLSRTSISSSVSKNSSNSALVSFSNSISNNSSEVGDQKK